MPGLKWVSRYQLALAILMFIGSPAWIGMLVRGDAFARVCRSTRPVHSCRCRHGAFHLRPGDVVLAEDRQRHRHSVAAGASRVISAEQACFLVNYVIETIYSILLCPILWFGHTIFLTGLLFGREIGWIGQTRDDHAVPFALAFHNLWPHTLLGFATLGTLALTHPGAIPYALFLAAGPALAIPFAIVTAWPSAWSTVRAYRPRAVARRNIASARAACA